MKQKRLTATHNFNVQTNSPLFTFKTDPEKLRMVLSNLLSNAVNFSFEGGAIEVKTWIAVYYQNLTLQTNREV